MKIYTEEDLKRAWEEGFDSANTTYTGMTKRSYWLCSKTKRICKNPEGGYDSKGFWVLIDGKV